MAVKKGETPISLVCDSCGFTTHEVRMREDELVAMANVFGWSIESHDVERGGSWVEVIRCQNCRAEDYGYE